MEKKKIAILLVTYNSELFLEDLLESILNQTNKNWTLYIIDDGSSDNTINIISQYVTNNKKIIFISNPFKHQGPKNNFMYLLSIVDAEYYMFCDHDDVWLPSKIDECYKIMIKLESLKDIPILIHTDLYVVDSSLNIISNSFYQYASIVPEILTSSINHLCHSNCVVGCTTFFNSKVKNVAFPISDKALMHDSWIALKVLVSNGIIYSLNKPLIYYRQHGNNTLGAVKKDENRSLNYRLKAFYKQYMMAYEVTNINILKFVIYRVIYLLKRKWLYQL